MREEWLERLERDANAAAGTPQPSAHAPEADYQQIRRWVAGKRPAALGRLWERVPKDCERVPKECEPAVSPGMKILCVLYLLHPSLLALGLFAGRSFFKAIAMAQATRGAMPAEAIGVLVDSLICIAIIGCGLVQLLRSVNVLLDE